MYFPFLRGKQFELIAVRELIERELIGDSIFPIIEPVKISSSLKKTVRVAYEKKFRLGMIFNPGVGGLIRKKQELIQQFGEFIRTGALTYSCIVNENLSEEIYYAIQEVGVNFGEIVLVHLNDNHGAVYNKVFTSEPPLFNLIPGQISYARKVKDRKVLFDDKFTLLPRNSDYANQPEEFFSEDHLIFTEYSYSGFSDYVTVGNKYSETGFRPWAVAIHVTYFDNEEVLRINHFVSDSNDDDSDTPRKYYEALEKLVRWVEKEDIEHTFGLSELIRYYDEQSYPGLGTLKKLSIMHHLETVNKYLIRG